MKLNFGDPADARRISSASCKTCSPTRSTTSPRRVTCGVSFETPEYTANADALGTLRLLEAIRILGLQTTTRFYQASTSEMFGKVTETPQIETHAVLPALAVWRREGICTTGSR